MPRDLILHIGTSKTGSTSIQRVLSRQRKALLEQGIAYPRSPGAVRHPYLAWAAMSDRKRVDKADRGVWKGMDPQVRVAKFRTDFDREMNGLPKSIRRVILSSEELSMRLLDDQSVQNLKEFLHPYFDDISVIVWLRRPDQHYASLYSQMLRWGEAHPPSLATAEVPPAHGYDFDGLLDRWARSFGEAAIKPQLFERANGKRPDVVRDFLTLCDIKLDIEPDNKSATANESLSAPAQEVLVRIAEKIRGGRKQTVASLQWRRLVEAAQESMLGKSWQPTREEAVAFVAQYADNHEAVRRRWFPERMTLWEGDYSELPENPVVVPIEMLLEASLNMLNKLASDVESLEKRLAELSPKGQRG